MKTSNYILIGFLAFITLVLVSWHVDSMFHEEEYDKKKKARTDFYYTRQWLEKNKDSIEKIEEFIVISEEYFKYYNGYYDYASAASLLNDKFNLTKDTFNLKLAKKWIDKAHKLEPNNRFVNEVCGRTLLNLGLKDAAKPHIEVLIKQDSAKGITYEYYKNAKGDSIKVRKPLK
ncbi:hypothetical protein H7U19_05780 [Hyunsoonleella sp. SJ7]|uniref:Uncharacterized protein n=1 Tax=Hyunsoonleella aquatilis TaxID=2762758 RepID=A0A923HAZ5_9FLAO|nr:hypothetical protein [Hyunsoonleella aquatilis]MBC3757904.1 hypothetical protein [Hyunsoonleella aquatilis]